MEALDARLGWKISQVGLLGCAEDLDPFLREIIVKAGKREAGAVDRRLANFAMKSDLLSFQLQLEFLAVARKKLSTVTTGIFRALFA